MRAARKRLYFRADRLVMHLFLMAIGKFFLVATNAIIYCSRPEIIQILHIRQCNFIGHY